MKKKNILYVSFLVGVIAIFAYLVMAMDVDPTTVSNMGLVSPNNSISCLNYSGSLINVTADLFSSGNGNLTNVTVFFWNGSDSSQLVFNVTLTDNDADSNMTFNYTFTNDTMIPDGTYNITVNGTNASDSVILENRTIYENASRFVIMDHTAPSITINTENNTFVGTTSTSFVFNVTVTNDTGFTAIHYINITNGSGSSQGSDLSVAILGNSTSGSITRLVNDFNITLNGSTNLTEGRNVIRVYANDTAGNMNDSDSKRIIVWVDTTVPIMVGLVNGSNQATDNWTWTDDPTPMFTFNFTDDTSPNASCELFIDEVGYGVNSSALNNSQSNITANRSVGIGDHTWYINCTDLGGNLASSGPDNASIFTFEYQKVEIFAPLDGSWTQTPNNGSVDFTFQYQSNLTENASCVLWISNSTASWDFTYHGNHSQGDGINTGTNGTTNNTESTIVNNKALVHNLETNWTINCTFNGSQITAINDDYYTLYIDNVTPTVPALSLTTATTSSLTIAITTSSDVVSCTDTDEDTDISGSQGSWTLVSGGLSSDTSYSFDIECSDSSGRGSVGTGVFETSASSGSSGGGSGGGTSSSTPGQYEKTVWQSINKGETATISVDNGVIGITEVSFKAKETTYGAWVEVQRLDDIPAAETSFENKAYKNLKILANNVEDFMEDTATIKFKVEKKWLTDNKIDQGNMALFRLVDDKWTQLSTTLGTDDGEYIHYTAETEGFSYFVIGAKSAETVAAEEAAKKAAEPTTAAGKAVEAVKKGMSKGWIVTVVVLLVVVGAIIFFWVRRRR